MSVDHQGRKIPEYADPADVPASFIQLVESGPIARFNNNTERDAAIPAPASGHIAWVGSQFLYYYNGSWRTLVSSVPVGSGSTAGIVKLSSTLSGSTTTAATPALVKLVSNKIDAVEALVNKSFLKAGGTGLAVRWGTGAPPAGTFKDGALYFQY